MLRAAHRVKNRPISSIIIAIIAFYILWILIELAPFAGFLFHPFKLLWGQKSYIVLFQNNYELRPAGGFISAFGILNMKNGIPVSFNFEDVYRTVDAHPYVAPPEPVGKLLAHPTYRGHTFRDANFYPNFPDSAAEIEKFLHMTRPFQQVDGIIAVDMSFLENWLAMTGSITINGKQFSAENLLEQVENTVSDVDLHDLNALGQRKMIVKALAKKMALKTLLPWNLPRFFESAAQSFDQKHCLLFFKDETLERNARKNNWAGALNSESGQDFLAVVDANYGGAKSNRYINRNIFYYVDLAEGKSVLDVRIDQPNAYSIPLSADYRGYVRVYVPQDHRLVLSEVFGDASYKYSGREGDYSFAGLTYQVPIRASRIAHFEFEFPKSQFDQLTYRLNLRKQPGTKNDFYQVSVRLPNGYHLAGDDFEAKENIASYRGFLETDKALIFELKPDREPPRVLEQTLKKLNLFEMEWNEPVDPSSFLIDDWKIQDIDYENKSTDAVKITEVKVAGTRLYIKTEGMTNQAEERYVLEISEVSDFAGNKLGERSYTFFQRLN